MIDLRLCVSNDFTFHGRGHTIQKVYAEFLKKCKERFRIKMKGPIETCNVEELNKIDFLSSGSFGAVLLVQNITTEAYHAMKVIPKQKLEKCNKAESLKTEKSILHSVRFPFSIHLDYFSEDDRFVYFLMPFVAGGEMFTHLLKLGKFTETVSRFYAAQIVLVLEYLHAMGLIYRDLKPENILIQENGYLKITDFGNSKLVKNRTWTCCGTPEYLAPEVFFHKGYGKAVDWWALGVLIYEMNCGVSPFCANDARALHINIVTNRYTFPDYFSENLRDIIRNLLQQDLSRRYGNLKNGVNDIKEHKWFDPIDWICLFNKETEAPFLPKVRGATDTGHFHSEYSSIIKENKYAEVFANF